DLRCPQSNRYWPSAGADDCLRQALRVVPRIPRLIESLFSIQLSDQAALFNLSKKTRIDEVQRGEVLDLRIGLALEHRLERLVVGRRQPFQQIGLLVVKVGSFFRA